MFQEYSATDGVDETVGCSMTEYDSGLFGQLVDSDGVNCTEIFGREICPVNRSVETRNMDDKSLKIIKPCDGIYTF